MVSEKVVVRIWRSALRSAHFGGWAKTLLDLAQSLLSNGSTMSLFEIGIEILGWFSTATFLLSIVLPNRINLHSWGIITSITTGIYAYAHGATAIWVKWVIAFFFHGFMWWKLRKKAIN